MFLFFLSDQPCVWVTVTVCLWHFFLFAICLASHYSSPLSSSHEWFHSFFANIFWIFSSPNGITISSLLHPEDTVSTFLAVSLTTSLLLSQSLGKSLHVTCYSVTGDISWDEDLWEWKSEPTSCLSNRNMERVDAWLLGAGSQVSRAFLGLPTSIMIPTVK